MTFIIALKVWRNRIQNRNVLAYCDTTVSVEIVNSGKAKNHFSQACLRKICFITAQQNAVLKLVHLSNECNRISDCLSRLDDPRKREQFESLTKEYNVKFITVKPEFFEFTHDW